MDRRLLILMRLREETAVRAADPTVSQYPISSDFGGSYGITPGPDGAMWFTNNGNNSIGRITVP